jgi:hypothetical protein
MEQREEPLTYVTATPEQIAQARRDARRKLREARERMTPERWQELREFIAANRA